MRQQSRKRSPHMWLFPIAVVVFFFDFYAKEISVRYLTEGVSVPVVPNFFHLSLIYNHGIAFGLFDKYASLLLILISLSIFALLIYSLRCPPAGLLNQIAYGFIMGGAIGNLTDRIRFGYVTDFIDFRIWPVFNIADTFITIGVGLFIFLVFKKKSHAS